VFPLLFSRTVNLFFSTLVGRPHPETPPGGALLETLPVSLVTSPDLTLYFFFHVYHDLCVCIPKECFEAIDPPAFSHKNGFHLFFSRDFFLPFLEIALNIIRVPPPGGLLFPPHILTPRGTNCRFFPPPPGSYRYSIALFLYMSSDRTPFFCIVPPPPRPCSDGSGPGVSFLYFYLFFVANPGVFPSP